MYDILPELNGKFYIENLRRDYDIHFCRKNEVEDLVDFINQHWRKNHIFVLSRKLLNWQHFDVLHQRYNFVIARHRSTNDIHSILGFVPTSQFDNSIQKMKVWPCIWKSREDIHRKGLGAGLYYFLKTNLQIETIAILGISETALSIYKHWHFSTGKIGHYYFPNSRHAEILSLNREKREGNLKKKDGWLLQKLSLSEYEDLDAKSCLFSSKHTYKSKLYYINRYYNHPIYQYSFLALMNMGCVMAIMVVRECEARGNSCLRIVDYIGDSACLCNIGYDLENFLIQGNYEYADMIAAGFSEIALIKAGFFKRTENSSVIIPNYFEPFVPQNIDLDFAYKSVNPDYQVSIFKADADQDRPNILQL